MERRIELQGGGTLLLRQEDGRLRAEAVRPRDDRGLYKVWLFGPGGGRFLLGTLTPEGEQLKLRRTLSLQELERAACWPPDGGEAVLVFPFSQSAHWYCEPQPAKLIQDPILRGQVRGPMLCRREQDGFCLAAPFCTDGPVALESLFCLARVERLEGRRHLVWQFDRSGQPQIT
jgi:hypothetical protein